MWFPRLHNSSYQFLTMKLRRRKIIIIFTHVEMLREVISSTREIKAIPLTAGVMQNWWKWAMCNPCPFPEPLLNLLAMSSVMKVFYEFLKECLRYFFQKSWHEAKSWGKIVLKNHDDVMFAGACLQAFFCRQTEENSSLSRYLMIRKKYFSHVSLFVVQQKWK